MKTNSITLDQFLVRYRVCVASVWQTKNRVVCNDGFSISVQCGYHAYSTPRKNFADPKHYTAFELGFPNQADDLITEYAEEPDKPTKTVYPYVSRKIVEKLISKHGGIACLDI